MRSRHGGLFYSTRITQGTYKITSVNINRAGQGGGVTWETRHIGTTRILIENGKVNNIGAITLFARLGGNSSRTWNQNHDQVRNLFQNRHNNSNWNRGQWINNGINRPNTPVSPAVTPVQPTIAQTTPPTQAQRPVPASVPPSPVSPAAMHSQPQLGIEGALERAARDALRNAPQHSRIAIVYVTAPDSGTTDFITGELEFIWVNAGFRLIDRRQLDIIREEQHFHLTGEVDDHTAVSIGRIAGANIIVTGGVDGEGNLRRLRLRVIDTETAQVIGVASERM